MWDLKEIKRNQKYIKERLKNCSDRKEKELLELSFISNLGILNTSGSIRYTRFYNVMDFLTNNKFSLMKDSKYVKIEEDLLINDSSFMNESYLEFLITLATNIATEVPETQEK